MWNRPACVCATYSTVCMCAWACKHDVHMHVIVLIRVIVLTLVEQRAQIDQIVRVEEGGTARHTFDEVAQVARVGSRLLLEVREEHREAIALAQLPAGRRRKGQVAARDDDLAFYSRCSRR